MALQYPLLNIKIYQNNVLIYLTQAILKMSSIIFQFTKDNFGKIAGFIIFFQY